MGGTLYNSIPYIKYNFPVVLRGIYGISCQAAMGNYSYFYNGLSGWDESGFWISAKDGSGQSLPSIEFVTWFCIGTV